MQEDIEVVRARLRKMDNEMWAEIKKRDEANGIRYDCYGKIIK